MRQFRLEAPVLDAPASQLFYEGQRWTVWLTPAVVQVGYLLVQAPRKQVSHVAATLSDT